MRYADESGAAEYSSLLSANIERVGRLRTEALYRDATTIRLLVFAGLSAGIGVFGVVTGFVVPLGSVRLSIFDFVMSAQGFIGLLSLCACAYLFYRYSQLVAEKQAADFDIWVAFRNLVEVTKRTSELLEKASLDNYASLDLNLRLSEAEYLMGVLLRSRIGLRMKRYGRWIQDEHVAEDPEVRRSRW